MKDSLAVDLARCCAETPRVNLLEVVDLDRLAACLAPNARQQRSRPEGRHTMYQRVMVTLKRPKNADGIEDKPVVRWKVRLYSAQNACYWQTLTVACWGNMRFLDCRLPGACRLLPKT